MEPARPWRRARSRRRTRCFTSSPAGERPVQTLRPRPPPSRPGAPPAPRLPALAGPERRLPEEEVPAVGRPWGRGPSPTSGRIPRGWFHPEPAALPRPFSPASASLAFSPLKQSEAGVTSVTRGRSCLATVARSAPHPPGRPPWLCCTRCPSARIVLQGLFPKGLGSLAGAGVGPGGSSGSRRGEFSQPRGLQVLGISRGLEGSAGEPRC